MLATQAFETSKAYEPPFVLETNVAQNIYDHPDFFAGYTQLPRQVRGLNGAPEWSAVRAMMPDMTGKRVADLGSGFGWVSRWMKEQGAVSVLGFDLSQNMLARAWADTSEPGIEYHVADLDDLELPEAAFDLIFSALTFHYVRDFVRLIRMIHTALVTGGDLVFTIEQGLISTPPLLRL